MEGDAIFDELRRYRYWLSRSWNIELPKLLYIMLNPSKADAHMPDDATVKCIAIAAQLGFGSLEIVNLYSCISPEPRELVNAPDPIGEETDRYIQEAAARTGTIVLAWGCLYHQLGLPENRANDVIDMLRNEGHQLYCLRQNADGCPSHPSGMADGIIKGINTLIPF